MSGSAQFLKNLDQLEEILERDPDNLEQIHFWYEQFNEYDIDGNEPVRDLLLIFRGIKWVMQFEYTSAEELKEVAERQAVEIAEKEENWEQEREMLKEELSSLRERITSKAGMDEINEAFRVEIDSLNAENAHLKQIGRERDRELADQRDKIEELTGKIGIFERERNAWTNTQIQLEDTIRELNRRLSAKTDSAPRSEWESRKLKQRSEQALMLGNQLRNADAQNVELKERVESLTKALEEATSLLQETTKKYEKLREQFNQTTGTTEKLLATNQDLKRMLEVKDEILGDKQQSAEYSTQQLEELLRAKESQIQRLRESNQKNETKIEELQSRIQGEHSAEKEEELEKLRLELVEATNLARQMFGESLMGSSNEENQTADSTAKFRLRLVQANRELDVIRQQLELSSEERVQLGKLVEQKDSRLAQLYSEVDRIRKLAFGDADSHIRDLEKQIEFRDRQLSKLTLKCSLMQIDLENLDQSSNIKKPLKSKEKHKKEGSKKVEKKPKVEVKEESFSLSEEEEQKSISDGSIQQKEPEKLEEYEEPEIPEIKQIRRFNALELIKLFDDNEIDDQSVNDMNLLSSLFIELKRLNQQLEEKERKIQVLTDLVKEEHVKIIDQHAKFKKLHDDYEKFRIDIFGNEVLETDADILQRRIDELQIENMELRRFVDGVKIGGTEMERRFEEATRRLIHLGIQISQFERKSTNLNRRHKALSEECDRLRTQLMRLQSGDERRIKQLSRENEMNMIEIARLTNALVHSIPLQSYNKLLSNFKKLLHSQTIGQLRGVDGSLAIDDHGYETDIEKQEFDISLNEFFRQNRTNEQILTENSQLRQTSEILNKQIDYWKRQNSKQADEIQELNAFLDDLENQTDLKSMIANIERRFLQALHEQSDSTEEQLTNEKELKRLRREIHTSKHQWRQDRQKLVETIMGLQLSVQRLRSNSANSLSVPQLMALRTATEELKSKEQSVEIQLNDAELKLVELERKEALAEATRESVEQLLSSNFQLQDLQLAFQRSAFHIKTLANELKANQKKLDKMSTELKKQSEENEDLRKELNELVIGSVDPLKLTFIEKEDSFERPKIDTKPIPHNQPAKKRQRKISHVISDESSSSNDSNRATTPRPTSLNSGKIGKTVIYDNSEEYEREIEAIKKAALISIQNYKEQLERKDRAIEEYRLLLNDLSKQAQNPHRQSTSNIPEELPIKRSSEILNNAENEERDKQMIILRWEFAELEEANAQLAEQLRLAHESLENKNMASILKHTVSVQTDYLPTKSKLLPDRQTNFNDENEPIMGQKSPTSDSSDSGTAVNDLEDDEEEEISGNAGRVKGLVRSNSTRTIDSTQAGNLPRATSALSEAQIFQHRNEIRRLRSRISALELKNRELTVEYESLKQRTRHLPQRNPDPNAEVNILRKENDRMRRENKNLQQTLKTQSDQIGELDKKMKRKSEHMRDTMESWEEKKALEKDLRSARQKFQVADNKLAELNDKLERRDRLIENLNRAQNERVFSVDKYKNELSEFKRREESFQKTEAMLRNEQLVLQERIRDANNRIEYALKENHSLKSKQPKIKTTAIADVQTPSEWLPTAQTEITRIWEHNYNASRRPNFGSHPTLKLINTSTNTDPVTSNDGMKRELKKAKLEYTELMQQFDELNQNHEKLEDEYQRYRNIRKKETFNSAAVTLLEDKLRAKQREIDRQRQTIEQLEYQLQNFRINR